MLRSRSRVRPGVRLAASACLVTCLAVALSLLPAAAQAAPWPGHPDRDLVTHTVRPGDTATGLAVRYHAWTAELIRLNRLGPRATLRRGQVLRIPVVVSAARADRSRKAGPAQQTRKQQTRKQQTRKHRTHKHRTHKHRTRAPRPMLRHTVPPRSRRWLHADLSRAEVRQLIVRMARVYRVPESLALAVAWQESGWQQRRVSSAGALGVMQVMPDTGRWMRWYAGRPLRLRDVHDNILAGMLTLRTLRSWTRYDNNAIAAYYQGLGAVRKHGFYRDTHRYVRSVRAHQRRILATGSPV